MLSSAVRGVVGWTAMEMNDNADHVTALNSDSDADRAAGDALMKKIIARERLSTARAMVERISNTDWEKERRRQRARVARKRAEETLLNLELRQAKEAQAQRLARAPKI